MNALEHYLEPLLEGDDATRRARALIQRLGVARVTRTPATELVRTGLVSPTEAARLRAAIGLGAAALLAAPAPSLADPRDVVTRCSNLMDLNVEELWCLPVDLGLRSLGPVCVARGGPSYCAAHPRDILAPTLRADGTGLFLVHNHPSGDPTPSAQDIHFTDSVTAAARELGLIVHDHIVIGGARWASCLTGATGIARTPPYLSVTPSAATRRS